MRAAGPTEELISNSLSEGVALSLQVPFVIFTADEDATTALGVIVTGAGFKRGGVLATGRGGCWLC